MRAEQVVVEHVVQTKIAGTLGNEKGTPLYETTMTLRVTWKWWTKSDPSVSWRPESRMGES